MGVKWEKRAKDIIPKDLVGFWREARGMPRKVPRTARREGIEGAARRNRA